MAFAVGEIHTTQTDRLDSSGNWIAPYNLLRWNGNLWIPIRVQVKLTYEHSVLLTDRDPIISVYANGHNDIWFVSNSGGVTRYLNGEWKLLSIPYGYSPGGANKIWARSTNELYFVSGNGRIVRFKNNNWEKIESGTDVTLRDVYGSPDRSTIWIAGYDDFYGTVFLEGNGNEFRKVLEITDPEMPHPVNKITHVFKSLWTDRSDTIYLGAIGRIYAAPKNTNGYAKENIWWDYSKKEFPPETNAIRGIAYNDIFVAGYNLFVRHYNGKSWKDYPEIEGEGYWESIVVNKNLIFIVGGDYNSVKIARGYRSNK